MVSSGTDELADLTLGLYESLLDGAGIAPALDSLSRRIGASSHAVHMIRYRGGQPLAATSSGRGGVAGAPMDDYARYWVRHDPWAKLNAQLEPGVHDFAALVPPETLRASRIWNEWGRPNEGGFHLLGVPLQRDGDRLGGMYFHRREAEPPFGAQEHAVLAALFPHLGRLLAVEARLVGVREAPDTALGAALEALPDGVALLDVRRRLVFANAALRTMAAARDGLSLTLDGGLAAPEPKVQHHLHRAVTAALAALDGRLGLLPEAGRVAVPRPSGSAYVVRALPLRRSAADGHWTFRGAMLLVSESAPRAKPGAALLAQLFRLSPAEAALAASLAAGRTAKDHATRRGVSPETVKSQMAEIRRKTGCRRQTDLAALLARLAG
jgi:DNA-binding CsgD family transcriptional regulator/PAS domain-containing protein